MSSIEAILRDLTVRTALAERLASLLAADARVVSVTIGGSLGDGGSADQYSDVDLGVHLHPDVSNRGFAEDVPTLVAPVGLLLADAWGVRVLPDKYVRTLYFADYPLFWHADVGCVGGVHSDGSDLLERYHWPRLFKTWQETLKHVLRGKANETPDFVEQMLGRWIALPPLDPFLPPTQRLATYLDLCAEQTRTERAEQARLFPMDSLPSEAAVEAMFQHCDELRREYLMDRRLAATS